MPFICYMILLFLMDRVHTHIAIVRASPPKWEMSRAFFGKRAYLRVSPLKTLYFPEAAVDSKYFRWTLPLTKIIKSYSPNFIFIGSFCYLQPPPMIKETLKMNMCNPDSRCTFRQFYSPRAKGDSVRTSNFYLRSSERAARTYYLPGI